MIDRIEGGVSAVGRSSPPSYSSAANSFCNAVDRLNCLVGRFWALSILFVVVVVIIEVVGRSALGKATVWSNETTIYVSAVAYLLGGGYALAHRRHVRIDLVYARLSPRSQMLLDCLTFLFFVLYVGALFWVGAKMGWTSFQQGEGTGTPWNPPIWPIKLAIPIAALLLLLQGVANLLRDLGVARPESMTS